MDEQKDLEDDDDEDDTEEDCEPDGQEELYGTFAKHVSAREAFPEIEDLTVGIEETSAPEKTVRKIKYGMRDLPGEFVPCSNPLCHRGGVSLGVIIRRMSKRRLEEFREVSRMCRGHAEIPEQWNIFRRCTHVFFFDISIRYKNGNRS